MSAANILSQAVGGAIVLDQEYRFVWANSQAAALLARSPQALIGEPISACEEVLGLEFCRACQQVNAQNPSRHLQVWSQVLERWFDVQIVFMSEGLLVTFHDTSSDKQQETNSQLLSIIRTRFVQTIQRLTFTKVTSISNFLEQQRTQTPPSVTDKKLATILETITDGVFAIDTQWRFSYVNHQAAQLLQRDQGDLLGKPLQAVDSQILGAEFYRKCQEAANTQSATQFEDFAEELDRWFQYNLYPSANGCSIYFQDITARKQAEFEARKPLEQEKTARQQAEIAEEKCRFLSELSRVLATSLDYQTTFDTISHSIVPYLADYCIVQKLDASGVFRPVVATHCDPEKQYLVEALAQNYHKVTQSQTSITAQVMRSQQPALIPKVSDKLMQSITQDEQMLTIGRSLQPVSTMLLPLKSRDRILGTLLLVRSDSEQHYTQDDLTLASDVADRIAMAIDNTDLYQRSQEASRLKDEFLNNLSHELRTPLHAINGWAQMLNRRATSESNYRRGIETIERKAQELQSLIYDLLDLSRMIRGKLHLKPKEIDLIAIAQEIVASFQMVLKEKQIHLEIFINHSKISHNSEQNTELLIQNWERFQVWADAERMRQIIWHILSNAIKFTPKQGTVRLKLLTEPEAPVFQIVVEDSGKGISPNFLPHVFECFRQADGSSTRAYGGLGLGLSLVQYLVELQGGAIEVSSPGEDQGTTVTIQLPKNNPEQ